MSETVLAGRYRVKEQIGSGGMSTVYRAVDERINREMAVKIMKPDMQKDMNLLAQFRQEVRMMAKVNGSNVVHVIDFGTDGDREYMLMEYVPGKTLKDIILADQKLEPRKAARIMTRVLAGLYNTHAVQVVHQDVKPQNVLVSDNGYVYLTDFGIAAMEDSQPVTQNNGVLGTVQYMAPERIQRKPVSHLSDLYSAGILFYEMLTGAVPYGGHGETDAEITAQHQTGKDIFADLQQKGVPKELSRVVDKAMRVDPAERYQTAMDMALDIQMYLNGQPNQPVIEREPPAVTVAKTEKSSGQDAEKKNKWRKYAATALGFFLVIGVLLLAVRGILDEVINYVETPYLLDLSEEGAQWIADRKGVQLIITRREPSNTVPEGKIIYQAPSGGVQMRRGEGIYVTVSTGAEHKEVPNLLEKTADEAKTMLEKQGLISLVFSERVLSDAPWDTVVEQSPAPGTSVQTGSVVQLKLSGGCVTLPELKGLQVAEALNILEDLKLDIQEIRYVTTDSSSAWDKVGTQQFLDEQGNPLNPGAQAMAHTRVILAVWQPPEGTEMMEETNRATEEGE